MKNPFDFMHVENLKDIQSFNDDMPCVVMASPGMLQCGLSRGLFEEWCSNEKNGVLMPGYCVEGTLAKEILNEPKEIESMRGGTLKLNMSVDYTQNSQFIDESQPKNLFYVLREMNEKKRLKNSIRIKIRKTMSI